MKKLFALFAAVLFLFCSCAEQETSKDPEQNMPIDLSEELYESKVPDVYLSFGDGHYDESITKGGYDWETDNGDGTKTNTIACGVHPLQFENIFKVDVISGDFVSLVFEKEPLFYDVVRYEVGEKRDYEYTGNEKSEKVNTVSDTIKFKRDGKHYVYVLNVKYPEGNCEYGFELWLTMPVVDRLIIADGAESGELLLAGENGGLYTVNANNVPIFLDGEPADVSVLEDGMTVQVKHGGMILESYPAMFAGIDEIHVFSRGTKNDPGGTYFDICGLYMKVLSDLWETDSGLNSGAKCVSIDLSEAPGDMSESQKAAIRQMFQNKYGVMVLSFTMEELKNEGYLTAAGGSSDLYQWDNGVLMTVTNDFGEDQTEFYSLPVIKFNAMKWRSPLGAYVFTGCSAVWPQMGTWEDYTVGAHAIS